MLKKVEFDLHRSLPHPENSFMHYLCDEEYWTRNIKNVRFIVSFIRWMILTGKATEIWIDDDTGFILCK